MSFLMSEDEQDTIAGFMTMAVFSVVSDVLHTSIDEMTPNSRLVSDLGMTDHSRNALEQTVQDMFDGLKIDLSSESIVQDIIDQVLQDELEELEYDEEEFMDSVF